MNVAELEDEALFDFVRNQHNSKVLPYWLVKSIPYRALNKITPNLAKHLASSQRLKRYVFRRGVKKHLGKEELSRLREVYSRDKKDLEALTGLKFDKWLV